MLYTFFFISNQVAKGLTLKIVWKVSNLLSNLNFKNATVKILVTLWVKNFTFSIFSSLKLNFSTTVFDKT